MDRHVQTTDRARGRYRTGVSGGGEGYEWGSGIAWAESGDGRMADLLGGGRRRPVISRSTTLWSKRGRGRGEGRYFLNACF